MRRWVLAIGMGAMAAMPARAFDGVGTPAAGPALTLGGAAQTLLSRPLLAREASPRGGDDLKMTLSSKPGFLAGLVFNRGDDDRAWTLGGAGKAVEHTLGLGGFLQTDKGELRLDSALRNGPAGPTGADVGASYGNSAFGAAYAVRLGAGRGDGGASFSPNPALGRSVLGFDGAGSDVTLSFSLSQPITPNLSLTGTAGARHMLSTDAASSLGRADENQFLFGAGLGYRF